MPIPHTVNMEDAEAQLSYVIAQADEGQDAILTRNGISAVRIVPIGRPIARVIELIKRERAGVSAVSADDIRTAKEDGRA